MDNKVLEIGKYVLIIVLVALVFFSLKSNRQLESSYEAYKKNGEYVNMNQSKTISELKKENRELYDSIKNKKDVKQATIIKYKYKYNGKPTYLNRELPPVKDSVYTFTKENDTVSYVAKVKTASKPEWFLLDFSINDKLTIINREVNGTNETTITTNGGTIENASVFNKKDNRNNFFNRFSIGLNTGIGYGILTKKPDVYVGVGVNFRLGNTK